MQGLSSLGGSGTGSLPSLSTGSGSSGSSSGGLGSLLNGLGGSSGGSSSLPGKFEETSNFGLSVADSAKDLGSLGSGSGSSGLPSLSSLGSGGSGLSGLSSLDSLGGGDSKCPPHDPNSFRSVTRSQEHCDLLRMESPDMSMRTQS